MPKKSNATKKTTGNRKRKSNANSKKGARPTALPNKPYTIGTISNNLLQRKSLKKHMGSSKDYIGSPYLHCRTNPFCSTGSTGIPDGSSIRRVVFDHQSRSVLTCLGTSTVDIQFVPCIPYGALYRTTATQANTWTVDGGNLQDPNITAANTISTAFGNIGWVPGNCYPEFLRTRLDNPAGDNYANYPVPAARARVVSMGFKITYIGQPTMASGYYFATSQPAKFTTAIQLNPEVLNVYSVGSTLAATANTIGSVYYRGMNNTSIPLGGMPTQYSNRIDVGATGVLKASAVPDYKPVSRQPFYVCFDGPGAATTLTSALDSIPATDYSAIKFWDDRFDPTTIRIQGMTSGTSLLVETVICVEYEVDSNSILSRVAEPTNRNMPLEVNTIEKVLSNLPVARPVADMNLPMETAKRVLSTAVKAARFVPGPVGTAAGIVDTLAESFSSITI